MRPGLDRSPKFPLIKLKKIFSVNVLIIEAKNLNKSKLKRKCSNKKSKLSAYNGPCQLLLPKRCAFFQTKENATLRQERLYLTADKFYSFVCD
jgi:hypothetical protein